MRLTLAHPAAAALLASLPAATALVHAPAAAQSRPAVPAVDALRVDADSALATGSTLDFTVRGTPSGQARVRVVGTSLNLPLRETSRGVYTGSYTVRRADRIDPASLIRASLTLGARTTIANYRFPASFQAVGSTSRPVVQTPALRIDRFSSAPVGRLEPGTELRFSLQGAPGADASFELPGIASGLPMRELRPGDYEGRYTLRRQDRLAAGPVVATLRAGDRWVTARLAAPLAADNAPPSISALVPEPEDAVPGSGITIVAGRLDDAAGTGVDPRSVRLTLADTDVTPYTQVTPQSFSWRGRLSPGRHTAQVVARDQAGNVAQQSWTFYVGEAAMGAAPASMLPLQVTSPGPSAAVDGAAVIVQGRTAPGAAVRVKVDAVAPPVGNRVSVAQPVVQQTLVADADGRFSFSLGGHRAVMGTRYELTLTAEQAGQSNQQRLVLFQRPS